MIALSSVYIPRHSPVHALDPRAKLLLALGYSIALFACASVAGMVLLGALILGVLAASRLPLSLVGRLLAPVGVLAAFALVANGWAPAFDEARNGWLEGGLTAARILLLALASLILTLTTTATGLMDALRWQLQPLRALRVPVDDVATTLSLAVRFIPLTARELTQVRTAQRARCAPFDEGSPGKRLKAWAGVFVPLFVGLFRHAETLGQAMDARCYGYPDVRRTSLHELHWRAKDVVILALGIALFATAVLW